MPSSKARSEAKWLVHISFMRRLRLILADPTTWSSTLHEAVKGQELGIIPFDLELDYDYWTYRTYVADMLPRK